VPHGKRAPLVEAMRRLVEDGPLRERLGQGALRFAAGFSWDRCADETMALLERTMANGGMP
jgi:glycosyltransferase involved in cell wall biosynthesis